MKTVLNILRYLALLAAGIIISLLLASQRYRMSPYLPSGSYQNIGHEETLRRYGLEHHELYWRWIMEERALSNSLIVLIVSALVGLLARKGAWLLAVCSLILFCLLILDKPNVYFAVLNLYFCLAYLIGGAIVAQLTSFSKNKYLAHRARTANSRSSRALDSMTFIGLCFLWLPAARSRRLSSGVRRLSLMRVNVRV